MNKLDFKINREMILRAKPCVRGWKELLCSMSSEKLTEGFVITELEGKTSSIDDMFWATKALGPEYAFHLRMFAVWCEWNDYRGRDYIKNMKTGLLAAIELAHGRISWNDARGACRMYHVFSCSEGPGNASWLCCDGIEAQMARFKQMVADGGWIGGIEGLWEPEQ